MNIFNNKNTIRLLFFFVFLFGKNGAEIFAQTTIFGKITDQNTGEELIGANIIVTKKGTFVQGKSTDIDGNFKVKLDPGMYDIEVSYTGYATQKITDIIASAGHATKVDFQMNSGGMILFFGCGGQYFHIPLISQDETWTGRKIDKREIEKSPTRNINEMSSFVPGVSFSQ